MSAPWPARRRPAASHTGPISKRTAAASWLGFRCAAGCRGVTTAKLGEAEVMADAGIDDIFVAYAVIGADKVSRLLALARRCRVSTAVNSIVGARGLSDAFAAAGLRLDVLIEVDGGLNRGGVKPGAPALAFARALRRAARALHTRPYVLRRPCVRQP